MSENRFKCQRFQAIIRSEDHSKITRARCKLWTCQYCARKNAQQWRAGIAESVGRIGASAWTFFTFTLDSEYHDKRLSPQARYDASMNFIKRSWDPLMKRLKREYGKFEYIRVLEQHKSGALHIHMLASCEIPDIVAKTRYNKKTRENVTTYQSPTISKMLAELGYGRVYDARPLKEDFASDFETPMPIAKIVSYVTKYMTKHDSAFQSAVRGRKIVASRGIKKINLGDEESAWELKRAIFIDDPNPYPMDLSIRRNVTPADYEGGTFYPLPYEEEED